MTARAAELAERYLPQDCILRFAERAVEYDRNNTFFDDDFAELRDAGYLRLFVPEQLGGPGLRVAEVSALQRRLAQAAPATALGINMHLVCTGVARALFDRGDASLQGVLEDARAGEVYAFGISEAGNDWVLYDSTTRAKPAGDGYTFNGTKIFTSLSPVWTRLLAHGRVGDEVIFGVIDRATAGITVSDHWDVLGMRATQSRSTHLDDVAVQRVLRRLPAGLNDDALPFTINAVFQLLIASVYAGIAERALVLGAQALHGKSSAKAGTTFAEIGEYRVRLADAGLRFEPVDAQLSAYTRDFDEQVDHGTAWPRKLVSVRLNAVDAARECVAAAVRCAGGRSYDNAHELSRLTRDAQAGLFHPSSAEVARAMFAAALLDQPA